MTLYVGIAGWVEGCSKESLVVNLLLTAPGKWTLVRNSVGGSKVIASGHTYRSEPGL